MNMKTVPTRELQNIVKALSMHSWRNTKEENDRLESAKNELKKRRKRK